MNIISDFKSIHGDRYDYSLVDYKHLNTKIQIICKKHNIIFEQTPRTHLIGKTHVCAECIRKEVIESFKQIHVNKYDYSLMEYTGALNKIKIICPEHGVFEQTPNNHKNGRGCSHCASELTVKEIYQNKPATLYYLLINDSQHKVGITKTSVSQRYQKELKDGIDIKIIKEIEFQNGYQAFLLEQEILRESKDRGTLLKENCIIKGGYSEVRTSSFIDIFDKIIN